MTTKESKTKTLWLLAVDTGISIELHAIYATDQADARRQANEKEHSGKHIDLRECPRGFTIYRLVLPGKIEVCDPLGVEPDYSSLKSDFLASR